MKNNGEEKFLVMCAADENKKAAENKIYKLLDFTNEKKDIADPWYTGNFTTTYEEVLKGCQALYNYLTKE